jgi:hypothetical protein
MPSYGSAITQLILEQARARAEGVQQRGQIWGNAIANLGQIPNQMVAANRVAADDAMRRRLAESELTQRAQQGQLTQQQIAAGNRSAQDVKTVDQVWSDPTVYNTDGTINREGVLSKLRENNAGHLAPQVLEHANKLDESTANLRQKAQALRESQRETLGREALRLNAAGNDPGMFALTVSTLSRPDIGIIPPQQANQYLQAQTPEQVSAITKTWKAGTQVAAPKLEKLGKGESLVQTAPGEAPRTLIQAAPDAAEAEHARHNLAMEGIAKLNIGREQAAQKETERHNKAMEAATNPFTTAAGAPSTSTQAGPSGDEFLKTLPAGVASEIKAYAEGRRPFPAGMSYAKLQPLIQLVGQYDPTFDAANYNARAKARIDLTSPSGTGGKTINALNTAIQHAGRLSDLIETLDNYQTPLTNAVVNPLRTATGGTAVTNYKAVAPQLAKEIERAWRGAGGSTADIKELIDSIGPNMGKQQQREALSQFMELAKGKLDATQTQRDNVLGPTVGATIPILFDQNKSVMEKIAQRAGSNDTAQSGSVTVTAPNGKSYVLKNQEAADAFVAEAKAKGLWK